MAAPVAVPLAAGVRVADHGGQAVFGLRAPEVFVHRFRSFPYIGSGVFVQLLVGWPGRAGVS